MLQQNHLCSHLLQRPFLLHLPTPLMMLAWMLRPEASGVGPRMHASSYHFLSLTSVYKHHEDAKKRQYGHRVRDIEHGIFTPLVITSNFYWWHGVWGHCILQGFSWSTCHPWGQEYSQTIKWLRCCLSFALLHCAILCIRRSRSSAHHPALGPLDLSVVLAESRLTN